MVESEIVNERQDIARREQAAQNVLQLPQNASGTLPADLPKDLRAIDELALLNRLFGQAIDAGNLYEFKKQIPKGERPKP
jgi:hypothetical protein